MSTPLTKRPLPLVLEKELQSAMLALDELSPDLREELLARHRRNSSKLLNAIVIAFGIGKVATSPLKKVQTEYIPPEWFNAISDLDIAYKKLDHYQNGGAEDYVAIDVQRAINASLGKGPPGQGSKSRRKTATDLVALKEHLEQAGFFRTTDKAKQSAIKNRVADEMEICIRTVNRNIPKIHSDS